MNICLFSGNSNRALAEQVASQLGLSLSPSVSHTFRDGNLMVRLDAPVRGREVYILQSIGLDPNNELMELLFFIDAARRASAQRIHAIIPYFGYAKGDKLDEPQTSIRAKVCADLLEVVGLDSVVMLDLHAPQIEGFFRIPVDHLSGRELLAQAIDDALPDPVVFSPDAGFVKDARKFAALIDADIAIGDKVRRDHSENPDLLDIIGEVAARNMIIVDDFSITANTLVKAAAELKRRGAGRIMAAISHGLFNREAIQALEASAIEKLWVLDSVNNSLLDHPKIEVVSAAGIIAGQIRAIQAEVKA